MSRQSYFSASLTAAAVALLLATGCRAHADPRQGAVQDYLAAANTIEQQLTRRVQTAQIVYRRVANPRLLFTEQAQLARAAQTLELLRSRTARLKPPPLAQPLHRDLLRLLDEQTAAARQLSAIAHFIPRYQRLATAIAKTQQRLQQDLQHASNTDQQASALQRYANGCAANLARLRPLQPPRGFERYYRARATQLHAARSASLQLAQALQKQQDQTQTARLATRFEQTQRQALRVEAINPITAARTAFLGHLKRAARLQLTLARDQLRLDRALS